MANGTGVIGRVVTPLRAAGHTLAKQCYKDLERSGQRQNYFRKLSIVEWARLYGKNYVYSSDYICAHPSEFSKSVRLLAKLGNRSEEVGEVLFRAAGCVSRMVGGLAPGTLHALTGRARLANRILKKINKSGVGGNIGQADVKSLVDFLIKKEVFASSGIAKYQISDDQLRALIESNRTNADCPESIKNLVEPAVPKGELSKLHKAITEADLGRLLSQRSLGIKIANTIGCGALALCYTVAYGGLKSVEASLMGLFFMKLGMVSATAYAMGFVFRSAATILARASNAHQGYSLKDRSKPYRSVYDECAYALKKFRGANPITGTLLKGLKNSEEKREKIDRADEKKEPFTMAYLAENESSVAQYAAKVSKGLDVATDIMFSLDRIIGQGLSRSLQTTLFRYEDNLEHSKGVNNCNYDWSFRKGDKFRKAIASFVGRGGADCLGMAVGCATCSAAWTGLNLALPGGAITPLATINGVTAGLALGFASVAAMGWGASAIVDAGVQLAVKTGTIRGAQVNADTVEVLDPRSNALPSGLPA